MLLNFREMTPGTNAQLPPLVLLNAMGLDSRDWPELPALGGRRVVALDRRGHGATGFAPTPTADAFADDVLETLDAEGIAEFAVVGISMGGCEAIDLATRVPGRVTDLIAVNTFVLVTAPERERRLTGLESDFAGFSVEQYAERLIEGMTYAELSAETRSTLISRFTIMSRDTFRGLMEGLYTLDLTGRLDRITARVTVAGADHDRRTPLNSVREVAAQLPNAAFRTITGAGHFPHIEAPEQFVAILAAALETTNDEKE